MNIAAALGAILIAAQPVIVQSTTCPSGPEVERALLPLLPSLPAGTAPDQARLVPRGPSLHIELQSPDGVAIADRDLEQTGSCAELARIVAVVIAAWESDVHPAFVRPPFEIVSAPSEVAPSPAPSIPPPVPVRAASYDFAAGGGLSFSESAAAGAVLAVTWAPHGTGFALRVGGTGESQHDTSLGQGQAQWRRWAGFTEVGWRMAYGRAVLDLHAGLLLGLLTAQGRGFSPSQQASSFSPGLTAGTRVALWAGRSVGFWLDVMGSIFQRNQSLVVSDPFQTQRELSHYQGLVSLGLAVGRAPGKKASAR